MKRLFIIMTLLIVNNCIKSQSFVNDANWEYNSLKSDFFNDTILDTSKWQALNVLSNPNIGCAWGEASQFIPQNVTLENGILKFKVDHWFDNYYYTGGIQSVNFDYGYGYYEIYAKFPGYLNNGVSCGQGFWPAFWLWYWHKTGDDCYEDISEVDFIDPGPNYADAMTLGGGWAHVDATNCHNDGGHTFSFTASTPLFQNFHKYGAEWLPDRFVFYFDDHPYFVKFYDTTIGKHFQRLVIDQQVLLDYPINANTPLPQYMEVDYFKYYTLKKDCDNDANINSNTDLQNFIFRLKRNITLGNGANTISLSSNDKMTFRATTNITINGEFTAPLGSELFLLPTPCDDNLGNNGNVPWCNQ